MNYGRISARAYDEVQAQNLCNTCAKYDLDCGHRNDRVTKIVRFHPRSAGYITTTACEGYLFWPGRSELVAPPGHLFVFGSELLP